jgi:hypothetical protein
MATPLPSVPSLRIIKKRLPEIFPEGTENRAYVVRDISASAIFVMFYVGAVEGTDVWVRPDQVTKMSDGQALKTDDESRKKWTRDSLTAGKMKSIRGRWYASNTREPIRDETLRMGLVLTGAVLERHDLPTTSAKPRYALSSDFAALFDEDLSQHSFQVAAREWQEDHLTATALARVRLRRRGTSAATDLERVLVTLPNGETRQMAPGPSSVLTKEAIEVFAPRFLSEPAVVFLSESGNKVVAEDQKLARSLGLNIAPDRNLPDLILADIGPQEPLLVFLEVVVTDGAITRPRKEALLKLATDAGFKEDRVAFVSVFEDRSRPAFRRLSTELAWGSVAWLSSEPECLILFIEKGVSIDLLARSLR